MTDRELILAGDVRTGARLMRGLDDRRPEAITTLKRMRIVEAFSWARVPTRDRVAHLDARAGLIVEQAMNVRPADATPPRFARSFERGSGTAPASHRRTWSPARTRRCRHGRMPAAGGWRRTYAGA